LRKLKVLPPLILEGLPPKADKQQSTALAIKAARESPHNGAFSKLEKRVDHMNPKFHVLMNADRGGGKAKAVKMATEAALAPAKALVEQNTFYYQGRRTRPLYQDEEMHVMLLELALSLLLSDAPLLDKFYTEQFPLEKHRPNVSLPFMSSDWMYT
jgi:hypothetical protein